MKCGQIAWIVVDVADDDRLARVERCPAQPLGDWKAGIRGRFVTRFRKNDKCVVHDLVDANPAIIARRANHFHELSHPLWCPPASERECSDLLQLLARRFLHSRESNLVQKKTSASEISTFCN